MTQPLEPVRQVSYRRPSDGYTLEREISLHVNPDVVLHQTRERTARRHFLRRFFQLVTLMGSDAAAAAVAALFVRVLVARIGALAGELAWVQPGIGEFCVAVLIALALTGNYQRVTPAHATLRLLIGSALGAVVVYWSNLWRLQTLTALPVAGVVAVATAIGLFLMRGLVSRVLEYVLPMERIVLAADGGRESVLHPGTGYRLAGTISLDWHHPESRVQEVARTIRRTRAEAVILMGNVASREFERLLQITFRAGCEFLCTPPGYGLVGVRPTLERRSLHGLVQIGSPSLQTPQFVAKRCVDVIGSVAALLVTAPLWLIIALAIRLDSPGPIFFAQERVGLGGRRFRMLKFRTMRVGADEEKAQLGHLNASGDRRLFKIPNDPRISRVGHVLRRWSLDELPQFLNVIAGQMSLVGPRPFFEDDFEEYEEHHFQRLGAKPGITGLWQVYGRSSILDFEEVVRMDTEYIDRWSLWMDLRILAMTLPAVIRRTGAC
jgi:exopolysaccharide biosynthesis polyprenyl glycosylphosphotransferase